MTMLCISLVVFAGCGSDNGMKNSDKNGTAIEETTNGNNEQRGDSVVDDMTDNVENAADDMMNGAKDAVDDMDGSRDRNDKMDQSDRSDRASMDNNGKTDKKNN